VQGFIILLSAYVKFLSDHNTHVNVVISYCQVSLWPNFF